MYRAVHANLRLLEQSGRQLGYNYRKNLMNLYLGLLRFEFAPGERDGGGG
jgi:hypothetical protein